MLLSLFVADCRMLVEDVYRYVSVEKVGLAQDLSCGKVSHLVFYMFACSM